MRRAFRFLWVTLLAAIPLSCLGRIFLPESSPSEPPSPTDPREIAAGVALWATILLVPVVDLLYTRRRPTARAAHACPFCGYDTRATPDQCPECGSVLTRAAGNGAG